MLQDIDWAALSDLDKIGVPMAIGSTLDENGAGLATRRLLTVPEGHCFIITSVSGFGVQVLGGLGEAEPSLALRAGLGPVIRDAGNTIRYQMQAMPFWRWQNAFNASAANTWRNSHPAQSWTVKPKQPICVPSGWHVNNPQPVTVGNGSLVRGYLISDRSAAQMGFDTNTSFPTRRAGVLSAVGTAAGVVLIPAKAGKSIQILDLFVRVQPQATGAANRLLLEQTDSKAVFQFWNDNPANLMEKHLSPGLFLKAGEGLRIVTTANGTGSAMVNFRYVDAADVPSNHWWSCVSPTKPGWDGANPSVGATAVAGANGAYASTALAAYYPAKNITVASALAGPANQNILKGYVITMNRDATAMVADTLLMRLSTGASGGEIGFTNFGESTVGSPVSPVLLAYSVEQTLWDGEDDIIAKSKTNEGFFFDSTYGFGVQTTATVRNWSCTAWGLTVPAVDAVGTRVRGTAT